MGSPCGTVVVVVVAKRHFRTLAWQARSWRLSHKSKVGLQSSCKFKNVSWYSRETVLVLVDVVGVVAVVGAQRLCRT